MDESQKQIIERAMKGDIAAFGLLAKRHYNAIYGLAFHFLRNFDDAQDLAQEVFIEAFQHLGELRDPSKFASWLRGITINLCKMWLRSYREAIPLERVESESSSNLAHYNTPTPAEQYEDRELKDNVMRAVGASSRDVGFVFTGEGLMLGITSWLLAVPLGIAASPTFVKILGDVIDFPAEYYPGTDGILLWLGIVIILSIFASWLPARRATRISVRESLAYE